MAARNMADVYTEVSAVHIMPGVRNIERLSLPESQALSREERGKKVNEIGKIASQAHEQIKQLANSVRIVVAMTISWAQKTPIRHLRN